MRALTTFAQQTLTRTRHAMTASTRAGGRSLALGAVLLIGSTVGVMATANTPPHITSVSINPNVTAVNEGQTVTVNGTFTDPDVADLHTVYINWYHGSKKVQLAAGQYSFQTTITLTDDSNPNISRPSLFVDVRDRQFAPGQVNDNREKGGQDGATLPLKVNNVAPTFAHAPDVSKVRGEPGKVIIQGDITDPGADTFQVWADWTSGPGLGNGTPCTVTQRHYRCEHTYPGNVFPQGQKTVTQQVKMTVRDDDGGVHTSMVSVQLP